MTTRNIMKPTWACDSSEFSLSFEAFLPGARGCWWSSAAVDTLQLPQATIGSGTMDNPCKSMAPKIKIPKNSTYRWNIRLPLYFSCVLPLLILWVLFFCGQSTSLQSPFNLERSIRSTFSGTPFLWKEMERVIRVMTWTKGQTREVQDRWVRWFQHCHCFLTQDLDCLEAFNIEMIKVELGVLKLG